LELLRSVVIKLDKTVSRMDDEITDLRSRSMTMRDNILIYKCPYTSGENLEHDMPNVIKETLGIDLQSVHIHRNGILPQYNSRPVTVTAKLVDGTKK
jgi:hypothetical protein